MRISTREDLERLRSVNPDEVDRSELVDIRDITVESQLPTEERIADFVKKSKTLICANAETLWYSLFLRKRMLP